MAKEFVKAISSNSDDELLKELLEKAENQVKTAEFEKTVTSEEKLYFSIMKKVYSKGPSYVSTEWNRIKGLLNENLRDEKKWNFQKKLNVLKVFKKLLEWKKEEL